MRAMNLLLSPLRRLDGRLDLLFARRPRLRHALSRYGWLLFVLLAVLLVSAGAAVPAGRGQQIIYATEGGGISAVTLGSGERVPVYEERAEGYATAPELNGGSRSLAFTVLYGEGGRLRGDLYAADLVRGTRALTQAAEPGEAYLGAAFERNRLWLMASRYAADESPNVAVFHASGATERLLEPDLTGTAPLLGPTWTAESSLYAWRAEGDTLVLTAYNFFERRQTTVYQTEKTVGPAAYYFDANAFVFAERPRGADLERSRLRVLAGTGELPISGGEGLGLYDPSLPIPALDYAMAVMWTDGERTGVGLLDPDGWTFQKTGVLVEPGSRYPRISYDGTHVATARGSELTVRRLEDGEVVLRVQDLQPRGAALGRVREGGLRVPPEADALASPNFSWRSFEGS